MNDSIRRTRWNPPRGQTWFALLAACACFAGIPLCAAENEPAVLSRAEIDTRIRADLLDLAQRCDQQQMPEQAKITRAWLLERDPRRLYLYSVPATKVAAPPANDLAQRWQARFEELKNAHAARLFARAVAVAEEHPAEAWQLAHETLHVHADHAGARAALGYRRVANAWRGSLAPPVVKQPKIAHARCGWPGQSYWRIETPHFEISTNESAAAGLELGERLEDLHAVWRQLFVRFWTNGPGMAERLQGRSFGPPPSPRKFQVVLFRNVEEYRQQMARVHPQIAVTLGVYLERENCAFFYAGDKQAEATWLHEATHQLFQESGRTPDGIARDAHVWLVEGIALYMESLQRHGDYFTLGGLEAERLQFARYRALFEKQHVPLAELAALGREAFQRDPRLRQLYSQAAGQTHFLMHGEEGRFREPLVDLLYAIYTQPSLKAEATERLLGASFAKLDEAYPAFLNVTDADLAALARTGWPIKKLVLCHTRVTDAGLAPLAPLVAELDWLDLSHTSATDAGLAPFAAATKLTQVNLEATALSDRAFDTLTRFTRLQELDLTGTGITDAGAARLAAVPELRVLYVTNTQLTDASVPVLSRLVQLETLGIRGTRISASGQQTLQTALPKWKRE